MASNDEDEMAIQQLAEITGTDEAFAHYMLQENDYDLNRALTSYFNAQSAMNKQPEKQGQDKMSSSSEEQQENKKTNEWEGILNELECEPGTSAASQHHEDNACNENAVADDKGIEGSTRKRTYDKVKNQRGQDDFPEEMTLLSWNVDGLDKRVQDLRFKAALCIIAKINPEVIFLQEMVLELMQKLVEVMSPMYNISIQEPLFGLYFCVTLVSKNIAITNEHTIPFNNTSMGRGLLVVEGKWQRLNLRLLNTHLESTMEFSDVRKAQFLECIEHLRSTPDSNSTDTLAIFGGDLNIRDAEIGDLPMNILDAWKVAGSQSQHQYTWDRRRNDNIGENNGARFRFDRIYFTAPSMCKSVVDFRLEGTSRIKGPGCFVSDHFAIACRFKMHKLEDDNDDEQTLKRRKQMHEGGNNAQQDEDGSSK